MKLRVAIGLALFGGLLLIFFLDPAESILFPACPFRSLTGLLCPGCGTLRGLHQLAHGRVGAAFGLNPLMVVSIPFLAAGVVVPRIRPGTRLPAACIWGIGGGMVAYGVLRNLPLA